MGGFAKGDPAARKQGPQEIKHRGVLCCIEVPGFGTKFSAVLTRHNPLEQMEKMKRISMMLQDGLTFSNPVNELIVTIEPNDRQEWFLVEEQPKKGQRVLRWIGNKDGEPKATKFSSRACIVTGSDGQTYILQEIMAGHISVLRDDMRYEVGPIRHHDRTYWHVMELLNQASLARLLSGMERLGWSKTKMITFCPDVQEMIQKRQD